MQSKAMIPKPLIFTRLVQKGDHVIMAAYAEFEVAEAKNHRPIVVLVDGEHRPLAADQVATD